MTATSEQTVGWQADYDDYMAGVVRIRRQLGLGPIHPATSTTPDQVSVSPGAVALERELHRREIARRQAAAERGKRYTARVSPKLIPNLVPIPVRRWWPILPTTCRPSVRRPFNLARRAVVASWPVADQRDHGRPLTTLLWALWAVVAASVAAAVVLVLTVVSAPVRVVRWWVARCRHRRAWRRYWAAQGYPVARARRVHRWSLTPAGVAAVLLVCAVGWSLVMGAIIYGGTTRLEQHRAQQTGQVTP